MTTITSQIHCGTPDNFDRVRDVLLTLQIWHDWRGGLTIYVPVPKGVSPDEHQDALTSLANAVTS